jgi:hypothetical protein
MRKFTTQLIAFLLICICLLLLADMVIENAVSRNASFRIKDDAKYIVLGNSHPEQAFNDSLIDNLRNLGQAAETYIYTYLKATRIIEQNKNIQVVFVEFSNSNLLPEWNKWIWGPEIMSWRYPIYSPFMDLKEKKFLFQHDLTELDNCLMLSIKDNFIRLVHHDFDYPNEIGAFLYNPRAKVDSFLAAPRLYEEFLENERNREQISDANLHYLEALISFLAGSGKKVYLIRCPLHKSFPGLGNEVVYKRIIEEKFKGIEFLDFKEFPLPNSDFVDLEHLNNRGAMKFSIWFNRLLKDGLLDKNDKQRFINSQMPHSL